MIHIKSSWSWISLFDIGFYKISWMNTWIYIFDLYYVVSCDFRNYAYYKWDQDVIGNW